jgi:hypothetical protein
MSQIEAISLIEASKQALEALEWCSRRYAGCGPSFIPESITSLRAAIASYSQAIAEAEKQDPHSWYSAQEDEWMTEKTRKEHERLNSYTHKVGGFDLPLYTHPQPKRRAEQHTEAEPSRSDIKQSTECVEPVAWMRNDKFKAMTDVEKQAWIAADDYWSDLVKDYTIPLYTTPQQRTWVGLTDDEADECACKAEVLAHSRNSAYAWDMAYLKEVEAKLKEKNTK